MRLTVYTIKDLGDAKLKLGSGEGTKIDPSEEAGSGSVQDKQKVLLQELIKKPM